jgi:excisionase family DNA binding protein
MPNSQTPPLVNTSFAREELPLRVRDAAVHLGVSPQTVYLWVERKQIPHLRVMGRNTRFLKSELEPSALNSNRGLGMARPSKHDGVVYRRTNTNIWWMRYRDKFGCRRLESIHAEDWQEAQRQLRERHEARDNNTLHIVRMGEQITFHEWADFFLENYSNPPQFALRPHTWLTRLP